MSSKKIQEKWYNYKTTLNKLILKGVPVVIFKFDRVFKIAVRQVSIRRLNREVRNSKQALEWDVFSNRVVALKKITPFAAVSTFIKDKAKKNNEYKRCKLVDFYAENIDYTLRAPKASAFEIINSQITNLGLDLSKDHRVYSQLKQLIDSNYFNFQLPITPMHGDISSLNLVMDESKLLFIDFELASDSGSILYDWWCLKQRMDENDKKAKDFNAFINKSLEKLELSTDQFNAFGYTMFSISSIFGFEVNKFKSLVKTNKYINKSIKIISRQEDTSDNRISLNQLSI